MALGLTRSGAAAPTKPKIGFTLTVKRGPAATNEPLVKFPLLRYLSEF